MTPNKLFTRDSLLEYLLKHAKAYPQMGGYHIEMRNNLLAAPPQHLMHDEADCVVILLGVDHK